MRFAPLDRGVRFGVAAALVVAGGCQGTPRADVEVPDRVAAVVEERIAEVRSARQLAELDPQHPEQYAALRDAARSGTPYVRFAAADRLAAAPDGPAVLDELAGVFVRGDPRFAAYCTARAIAERAARLDDPGAAEALYRSELERSDSLELKTMLGTLYLERSPGPPSPEVCRAAGLARVEEGSGIVQYRTLRRRGGTADGSAAAIGELIEVLEASVLPARPKDPTFPARAQGTVAALIDRGAPAVEALLARYGERTRPENDRDYLTLLYVVDVLQGAGDDRALPFLEALEDVAPLGGPSRKNVAMHRAGVYELPQAAAVARAWIESGVAYPYHDWLAGWYRWFFVHE